MISRARLLIGLLFATFSLTGVLNTADAQIRKYKKIPSTSLVELENRAFQEFKNASYTKAEQTYAQIQTLVKQRGYAELQPDLLFNQALVHYHLGKPALAQAKLRQAYLITDNELYQTYIDQIQGIIELREHKKSPNTVFVRGDSDSFMYWSMAQYYHPNTLTIAMFTSLSSIFAILSALILINRNTLKRLLSILLAYFIAFFVVLVIIRSIQVITDDMTFAVLLDSNIVRNEPNYKAPNSTDMVFLPGITVQVVSQHDSWSLIQHGDGQTAWIPTEGLYLLRSPHNVQ